MQCTSHVPVYYYHARDSNVGANGFSWHLFNDDLTCGEGRGFNISSPPYGKDQCLSYDKDVLRQIIRNHDATFRFQVEELHRLYRRQTELMDEIKNRGILMQHLQLQTLELNHCLSQPRSGISQMPSHVNWLLGDCSGVKMSLLSVENIQDSPALVAENFQQPETVLSNPFLTKNSFNGVKASSVSSKKHGTRILDLETPADVYHVDVTEQFGERNVSAVHEVTCNARNELSDIRHASDSKLGCFKKGELSSYNLNCGKTNFLIDLNEPVYVESLTSSSSAHFEICHAKIISNDSCVPREEPKPEPVLSVQSGFVNCDGPSDEKKSLLTIDLNSMPFSCSLEVAITVESLQNMDKDIKVEDPEQKLPILRKVSAYDSGVLCSPENEKPANFGAKILALNHISEGKDNQNVDKAVVLDCSSPHVHAVTIGKSMEDDPVVDNVDNRFLNIDGVVVDEPLPPISGTNFEIMSVEETDLKNAHVSAENEVSPPREKSEDIKIECPLFSEEVGEPTVELDRIIAETLIMISTSRVKHHLKNASTEPVANLSNSLHWFAELVSSIHQENEQSTENARVSSHVKKEEETGKLSNCFNRGGAIATRQPNDFQAEVLPSLASLSLHETSKDIQTIEPFQKTSSLRRTTGRNTRAKPRKCSKLYPLDVVGKSLDSILKQPATCSKPGFLQKCLNGWGKIKKRQEGHRRRASKFLTIT